MKKTKRGKNYIKAKKTLSSEPVAIEKAVEQVKSTNLTKFNSTVEVKINVNVDPKDSEQNVRFMCEIPHSLGKTKKVLAFGEFKDAKFKTLTVIKGTEAEVEKVFNGKLVPKKDFDIVVASPEFMPKLAKAAKVLGPKGLMPNPKTNTVGKLDEVLKELDKGQVVVRTQPSNKVIHLSIGTIKSKNEELVENFNKIIVDLNAHKPSKVKKDFIQSVYIKSTMSPSIKVIA